MHSKFLGTLDHLWNCPASGDDTETTTPGTLTSQDHLKRSILSGIGEIVMSIFRGRSSGGYGQATIEKITNLHILQQTQNLQSRHSQDPFVLSN